MLETENFNFMEQSKDSEILEGILNHDSSVINRLYEYCFPQVEKMVLNYGGDRGIAKDIFQDAMLILYRQLCNGNLKLRCKVTTYIYAVSKNLWIQEYKSRKYLQNMHVYQADMVNEPENPSEHELKLLEIFDRHFSRLSKDCQKILRMFFSGRKMHEIKKSLKYSSMHHTMDRKYRCKASLIKRIMNDPEFKELKDEIKKESGPLRRRDVG